ncbi:MAG: response regulator transcription factor [Desulfobulbaceae bacterium]|nr:response regulator transcription factor [Desulfobulbaceae bacterium]
MKKTRVLVVDDHELLREGVTGLISRQDDMKIVGQAANAKEGLKVALKKKPDVVVLDIRMEKSIEEEVRPSGLKLVEKIRSRLPSTKIIMHTMYERADYADEALQHGAMGYVLKTGRGIDLVEAVRAVRDGQYYLSPDINKQVLDRRMEGLTKEAPIDISRYDLLTEREQYVFRMVVKGYTTKEIAEDLGIGPRTVAVYRYRVGRKLGIKNRVELVKFATKIGIIDPEHWVGS